VRELFSLVQRRSTSGLANPAPWLVDLFGGGGTSKAGVNVNVNTALEWVFDAVQVRSQTIASLPFKLFRQKPNGDKELATGHPLYRIAHGQPHPDLTSFEFRAMLNAHLDLRGNAYAQIVRDGSGRVRRLVPLHPDRVRVKRAEEFSADGLRPLIYEVTNEGLGTSFPLSSFDVLHLRGYTSDGICGISPIRLKAETLGLGIAVNEHAARMFSNGAQPAGHIKHPAKLGDPGRENIRKSWQAIHGGVHNAGKVAILEEGMSYEKIGLSNEDAQLLESRKYSKIEVAAMYRVPPHMIGGEFSANNYNNVESMGLDFVKFCMLAIIENWEQRWNASLLSEEEQGEYFFKFNVSALLRGDTKSRNEAHRIALGRAGEPGWITVNDIREMEDMNRIEGGDVLFSGVAAGSDKPAPASAPAASARALLPLLTDALGRACRKEAKALRAILRKPITERPAEFDSFYADHRRHLIETVAPVFATARSLGAPLAGTEADLADKLIAESRAAAFTGGDEEKIFTTWETTRAATLAESLIA
jgi:HK97 family phage portal protein